MARRKKQSRTASFDGVGKGFAADSEYLVKCVEISVEDGNEAPYYSMKLEGTGDFAGAVMYHNASLNPSILWKTRDVFDAFLGEVPEGDFDIDEMAEEFVGKVAMCSTFKDVYEGKTRIKPEDFWAADGDQAVTDDSGEEDEIDLDEMDDDDIKKIGKAMGIKSKRASTIRKELADADEDELYGVLEELGLVGGEEEEGDEGGEGLDLDELDDDDIKALAKAAGIKGRVVKKLKAALEELDEDELAEAAEEAGIGGSEGGGEGSVSADDINGMNQDELEALVEEHELDVDLDDHKTLRKKRSAVVDAAEEAGILEEE